MRKVLFLMIVLQLFNFDLKGQIENELDSLMIYLEDVEPKERGLVLNRFSFLLREKNITQAFEFANEAEKIGIAINDSLIMAHAKENLGWIYYRSGVWDKAFRYSRDAYTISYQIKDNKGLAMAMNNLGVIYYKQKNYEEAIKKFKGAYSIGLQLEDPFIMVRSLNNAAINFLSAVEPDSAYYYAYKALKINNEFNTIYFNSFTYRVIGDIQLAKNQYEEAIDTYNFAQHTATHHMLESFEASILQRMGNAYRLSGNLGKSIELLEKGKDIALEKNFQDELIYFYKYLAMAYEQVGKLDLAYFNQMAYNRLSEILEERINKDRLALVSATFEVEKNDAEIRYLRAENDYQELQLKNFKTYNFLFTIGTIFLAVLFVWLWSMHKKTKAINIELYMNQVKIEEQKAELEKHSKNLNESNRLKDRLFSILGHDLKTPVSQLQGVLGLLHDNNLSKEEFY
ncbi:tetratricopeptide repeat protein, partial [Cecembia sp.]